MQHMTLLGAEDVARASSNMREAAQTMLQAAINIEATFERHQHFLDNWLIQFQEALREAHETRQDHQNPTG